MSDLDDLCDKVNCNRVKYGRPKSAFTTGSGLKQQFRSGITTSGTNVLIFYSLGKMNNVSEGRMSITVYSKKFDKDGNITGD